MFVNVSVVALPTSVSELGTVELLTVPADILPEVVNVSLPKSIAPDVSVMLPPAIVSVPAFTEVVTCTAAGNDSVNVSVALTTAEI